MAQTNYTPIQLYYSTTAAAVPVNTNLLNGELAINITDGKLYYKDNSGTVQVIATKGAGTIGGSTTQIQYNNAGALAGSSAMTFNNSTNVVTLTTLNLTNALGAVYGGTGLTSYTTGDLLYSSASNTLAKLAIGTANYILTVNSGGTNVQWSAPSSISVSTATNLAGGAAGSVPYQSAAATTTFLAIGAADRVMTSSGTAPQWVTALTSLTGVSSSSITNTSLTSGRVVYSGTGGLQTNSANLTFDGTTLTTAGLSNSGTSALVKLVTVGGTSFNGTTVFAAATPAKLYMGTGTVTDTTSAIGATNAVGAVASLAITPIAATNTSVTYTDAATLYIAGAPSVGTNISITNPYALYVAAGASYLGGNTAVTGTLSASLNTSALPAGPTGTILQIGQADGVASNITIDQFGGTTGGIMFRRTTGTNAAKTATNLATQASIGFTGYGATGYSASSRASVSWRTTEAWTDSAQGCSILISATPTGSTTTAAVLTISGSELAVTGTLSATGASSFATSSGNVGVGTASPAVKFDVNGNARVNELLLSNGAVPSPSLGTTPSWYSPASGVAALSTNAAERMRIDSSGNLGIGTSSPSVKLETSTARTATVTSALFALTGTGAVNDFNKITLKVQNTLGGSTGGAGIGAVLEASASNKTGLSFYYDSGSGAQTAGMRLDSSGNLGINSTSPATYGRLDIYQATDPGTTPAALSVRVEGVGGGTAVPQYGINVDAAQSYNNASILYGIKVVAAQNVGSTTYGVHSTTAAGNSTTNRWAIYGKANVNADATHSLSTLPVGVYGEAGNTIGTGNISTSAAGYFLNSSTLGAAAYGVYIKTTAGPTTSIPLRIDHASSELMRLDSSGNLLVGTTTASTSHLMKVTNITKAGIIFTGPNAVADNGTLSVDIGGASMVTLSENNAGNGALFFCTYASATITLISDPGNKYATSVTAGRISLTKSANSVTCTITNKLGSACNITFSKVSTSD
jgi:hypothetical protein